MGGRVKVVELTQAHHFKMRALAEPLALYAYKKYIHCSNPYMHLEKSKRMHLIVHWMTTGRLLRRKHSTYS